MVGRASEAAWSAAHTVVLIQLPHLSLSFPPGACHFFLLKLCHASKVKQCIF